MPQRILQLAVALLALASACTSAPGSEGTTTLAVAAEESPTSTTQPLGTASGVVVPPPEAAVARNHVGYEFPPAPEVPTGPPDAQLVSDLDDLFDGLSVSVNLDALAAIGASGDARAAWLLSDLLRFIRPGDTADLISFHFETLTGADLSNDPVANRSHWQSMTDHLIAWDLPAIPGYESWKAGLFTLVEPAWQLFFDDADATIDWRIVSWGGVFIDDRPLGDTEPCPRGCIPALDDPAVTGADGGDWYPNDSLVFGVTVGSESRAYPKNIMEVHEMVNDTLGGRRLGIPYCTLCGSAQAYFTDGVPDGVSIPVLRTSGLLSRSNKVMYDLETSSVFDTFTGVGVTGPLRIQGIVLEQASVVTSTWGDWKVEHPDTTIVAQDGGIGRSYDLDPLGGRDDNGPIFPVGSVDERLPAQAKVLGVITDGGTPLAFDVEAAIVELEGGRTVQAEGIRLELDGSGIRAVRADGSDAGGHEAFWFAWSQFHADTFLWVTDQANAT